MFTEGIPRHDSSANFLKAERAALHNEAFDLASHSIRYMDAPARREVGDKITLTRISPWVFYSPAKAPHIRTFIRLQYTEISDSTALPPSRKFEIVSCDNPSNLNRSAPHEPERLIATIDDPTMGASAITYGQPIPREHLVELDETTSEMLTHVREEVQAASVAA